MNWTAQSKKERGAEWRSYRCNRGYKMQRRQKRNIYSHIIDVRSLLIVCELRERITSANEMFAISGLSECNWFLTKIFKWVTRPQTVFPEDDFRGMISRGRVYNFARRSADKRQRHRWFNHFNKSTFKEISDANGERYSPLSKVTKPASYCRRAEKRCQCVSVNGAESSGFVVIREEDDFANQHFANIDPPFVTVSKWEESDRVAGERSERGRKRENVTRNIYVIRGDWIHFRCFRDVLFRHRCF